MNNLLYFCVIACFAYDRGSLAGLPASSRTAAATAHSKLRSSIASNLEETSVYDGTVLPVGSFNPSTVPSNSRRDAVREATRGAWDAYELHAWGFDEVKPVSLRGTNTFAENLGTTIVDSLSTLYIMDGLDGRYERARNWVDKELDFDKVGRVIVFETVIRILGGLVSMFHLSGDTMYLRKAEDLGIRLSVAFDTPHKLPWPRCYLNETGRCENHSENSDVLYLAEVGTVQLEYRALSHHSESEVLRRIRDLTEDIVVSLQEIGSSASRLDGRHHSLLPFALSMTRGTFSTNMVTLGAPADSYFEYLIKLWVQGGRQETRYWELFAQIADSVVDVFSYTSELGDVVVRDLYPDANGGIKFASRQDHFTCFLPGALILALDGINTSTAAGKARRSSWETLASQLTETCYKMYSKSPSGLAGEFIRLGPGDAWRQNGAYKLRPEAVEAMFYMYRHTGDERYREWAWEIFESMRRWCVGPESGAFAPLKNARSRRPVRDDDGQASFLIAETFKYLYLLFGDDADELPLDKWVFNTEAHPLLIMPGLVTVESLERLERLKIVTDAPLPDDEEENGSGSVCAAEYSSSADRQCRAR
jgi:hypothetical protein